MSAFEFLRLFVPAILVWMVTATLVVGQARAAEPTMTGQELIDGNAQRASTAEVKALLTAGAGVEHVAPSSGNYRRWTHEPDGRMVASSRGKLNTTSTAQGTWKVSDDGLYCVELAWNSAGEQWCRAVYRVQDALYLAPVDLVRNADKRFGALKVSGQAAAAAGAIPASGGVTASASSEQPAAMAPRQQRAAPATSAPTAATDEADGHNYLTKAEVEQTFIGKSIVMKRAGEIIQWEMRADGNLFGTNRTRAGRDAAAWQLADDGKLCLKWRGNSTDGCRYFVRRGDKFWMTESNQRDAPVVAEVQEIR